MAEVVVENTRLSYVSLLEPKANLSGVLKYSASVIIPLELNGKPNPMIKVVKGAVETAMNQAVAAGKLKEVMKPGVASPLRDGTAEYNMEKRDVSYNGSLFFNANANDRPSLVDSRMSPIMDPAEVYSGMWAHVAVSFYYTDKGGSPKVAVGLNHVMKIRDDTRLDGRTDVTQAFSKYAPEDEVPSDTSELQ